MRWSAGLFGAEIHNGIERRRFHSSWFTRLEYKLSECSPIDTRVQFMCASGVAGWNGGGQGNYQSMHASHCLHPFENAKNLYGIESRQFWNVSIYDPHWYATIHVICTLPWMWLKITINLFEPKKMCNFLRTSVTAESWTLRTSDQVSRSQPNTHLAHFLQMALND